MTVERLKVGNRVGLWSWRYDQNASKLKSVEPVRELWSAGAAIPRLQKLMDNAAKATADPERHYH